MQLVNTTIAICEGPQTAATLETAMPSISVIVVPKQRQSLKQQSLDHMKHVVSRNEPLQAIYLLAELFHVNRDRITKTLNDLIADDMVIKHKTTNAQRFEVVGFGFTVWTKKGRRNDHGNSDNIVVKPCITCDVNFPSTHKHHRMCDLCKKNA